MSYSIKPAFKGQRVNFRNKMVALDANLSQSQAADLVNAGLGRYFEGNPSPDRPAAKPVELKIVHRGAKADEIEKSIAEANGKPAAKAPAKKPAAKAPATDPPKE